MIIGQGLGQIDHGTLPAIEKYFNSDESNECPACIGIGVANVGYLNSLVFFGLFVGSMIASVLLLKFKPKFVLASSCVINLFFNLLFASMCFNRLFQDSTFSVHMRLVVMLASRLFIGMNQALVSIQSQVWINIHIHPKKKGIYMAALQGMLPIGIVVGYSVTIGLGNYWFTAFVLQAFFLFFLTLLFCFMPSMLDINKKSLLRASTIAQKDTEADNESVGFMNEVNRFGSVGNISLNDILQEDTGDLNNEHKNVKKPKKKKLKKLSSTSLVVHDNMTLKEKLYEISHNVEYVTCVITLISLQYIVTGIQFNMPNYMSAELHFSESFTNIVQITVVLLGLTFGVILGGVSLDRLGGVGSKQVFIATIIQISLSFGSGLVMLWMTNQTLFILCISGCLFFGAAFLPIAANIMLDGLSLQSKTLGNSIAQVFFNLLGFFPPNIMQGEINQYQGQLWAMFWNVMPGALGVFSMFMLMIYKLVQFEEVEETQDKLLIKGEEKIILE